jgi:hypothetical protein
MVRYRPRRKQLALAAGEPECVLAGVSCGRLGAGVVEAAGSR